MKTRMKLLLLVVTVVSLLAITAPVSAGGGSTGAGNSTDTGSKRGW